MSKSLTTANEQRKSLWQWNASVWASSRRTNQLKLKTQSDKMLKCETFDERRPTSGLIWGGQTKTIQWIFCQTHLLEKRDFVTDWPLCVRFYSHAEGSDRRELRSLIPTFIGGSCNPFQGGRDLKSIPECTGQKASHSQADTQTQRAFVASCSQGQLGVWWWFGHSQTKHSQSFCQSNN